MIWKRSAQSCNFAGWVTTQLKTLVLYLEWLPCKHYSYQGPFLKNVSDQFYILWCLYLRKSISINKVKIQFRADRVSRAYFVLSPPHKANSYCKNCFNDKLVTISNGHGAMSDSTRNRTRAVITSSTYNDAHLMIYILIVFNTDIPSKAVFIWQS